MNPSRPLAALTASFARIALRPAALRPAALRPARPAAAAASSSRMAAATLPAERGFASSSRCDVTIGQAMRGCRKTKPRASRVPLLEGNFQKKAVCMKVFTTKPRKPNSAVRKVARVKLSNGEVTTAYIAGEGHNLQEHSVVLVRGGGAKDLPGVRYKIIRGALDLNGVAGRVSARSKYGVKKPKKP